MVGSKAITYTWWLTMIDGPGLTDKGIYEVYFVISSEEQRYLADVIITH